MNARQLLARLGCVSGMALLLANCATQPTRTGHHNSREIGAFSHPKYGKASPRVVGLDERAPKGGGRYQVGKPYVVAGKRYVPREKPVGYSVTGAASWYGVAFHGRKTANGEIYDRHMISAAHPTMPLPSYARVTNLRNNRSIVVRVNDRGPYHGGRVVDLSERTAQLLDYRHLGTARVKVDYLGPAGLAGSDDARLVASLRTDGPAIAPGNSAPTMVAAAEPIGNFRPNEPLAFTARAEIPQSRPPAPAVITQTRFAEPTAAPLPPERPFDLETIAGAARPVSSQGVPVSSHSATSRPVRSAELSFVEPSGLLSRFGHSLALASSDVLVPPNSR